jgi:RNA polymerase sigma-70 factor (ECF subfamily)
MDQPLRGWIESYLDRLYGYAYALTRDADQSRDLVQECALRALNASQRPSDEPAYRAWLFRILRNLFIDKCRKNAMETGFDSAIDTADDVDAGWRGDRRIIDVVTVRVAVTRLSPAHREVISLVDLAGLSYGEAAEVLGVAEGTVMSRLSRARKALLAIMAEENITPLARVRSGRR